MGRKVAMIVGLFMVGLHAEEATWRPTAYAGRGDGKRLEGRAARRAPRVATAPATTCATMRPETLSLSVAGPSAMSPSKAGMIGLSTSPSGQIKICR